MSSNVIAARFRIIGNLVEVEIDPPGPQRLGGEREGRRILLRR